MPMGLAEGYPEVMSSVTWNLLRLPTIGGLVVSSKESRCDVNMQLTILDQKSQSPGIVQTYPLGPTLPNLTR